jgi:hypothetical protein
MESWMKRGFLQKSKSGSKSNASLSKDIIQADRRPEVVTIHQISSKNPRYRQNQNTLRTQRLWRFRRFPADGGISLPLEESLSGRQ